MGPMSSLPGTQMWTSPAKRHEELIPSVMEWWWWGCDNEMLSMFWEMPELEDTKCTPRG